MFDAASRVGRTLLDDVKYAATSDRGYITSALNNTLEGYYAGNKATSIIKTWGSQVPDIARSVVSPRDRALYNEQYVNPVAQRDIRKQLESLAVEGAPENKILNEAKARGEYSVYAPIQAGRNIPEDIPQKALLDKAYLIKPTEFTDQKFDDALRFTKNIGIKITDDEYKTMKNQLGVWLDSNKIKFNE